MVNILGNIFSQLLVLCEFLRILRLSWSDLGRTWVGAESDLVGWTWVSLSGFGPGSDLVGLDLGQTQWVRPGSDLGQTWVGPSGSDLVGWTQWVGLSGLDLVSRTQWVGPSGILNVYKNLKLFIKLIAWSDKK